MPAFFTLFLRGPQLQVPRWKPGSLLRLSRTPPTALRFFRESALFTPSASGGSWSTGTGSSIGSPPHKSTKRACPANCRFQEGDATNLHQVPEHAFDLVVSSFGAMFAPKPFEVAKETVRVTRPGGRITMGSWIPNDPTLVAQTLKISSAGTPPPPEGFVSPMTWGSGILTRLFDAANRFHIDDAATASPPDAFVHDEERDHIGREAIHAWIEDTTQKYHSKFEVTCSEPHGDVTRVTAKVSGDFPGNPIDLRYGKI